MKNDELRDSFCPKEWNDVKYLDEFDKRVIGAMLYSLAVSNEAKDWTLIKDMESLRRYCGIAKTKLYEVCNKLELIGFFKWERGEKRQEGRKNKAAHFYLNPDLIFNPPVEMPSLRDMLFQKFTTGNGNNNSKVKDNNKSNNNINNNEKMNVNENNKVNSNGKENLNEKVNPEEKEKTFVEEFEEREGITLNRYLYNLFQTRGIESVENWYNTNVVYFKSSSDFKKYNSIASALNAVAYPIASTLNEAGAKASKKFDKEMAESLRGVEVITF